MHRREGLGREEKSSQGSLERGHYTVIFLAASRFSIGGDVCTCDKVWENLSQLFSPLTESALHERRFPDVAASSMTRPKTETD